MIEVAGTVNACRGDALKPIQAQAVSSARKERENAMRKISDRNVARLDVAPRLLAYNQYT